MTEKWKCFFCRTRAKKDVSSSSGKSTTSSSMKLAGVKLRLWARLSVLSRNERPWEARTHKTMTKKFTIYKVIYDLIYYHQKSTEHNWCLNSIFKTHFISRCHSFTCLDQCCCGPEAHLCHRFSLTMTRHPVETWAGAGEGANGGSSRGDGGLRYAVAIHLLHHTEGSSSRQWVHNLETDGSKQVATKQYEWLRDGHSLP